VSPLSLRSIEGAIGARRAGYCLKTSGGPLTAPGGSGSNRSKEGGF